jgi:hypothetical protein
MSFVASYSALYHALWSLAWIRSPFPSRHGEATDAAFLEGASAPQPRAVPSTTKPVEP